MLQPNEHGQKELKQKFGTTFNDSLSYALGLTTGINYMGSLQLPEASEPIPINKGENWKMDSKRDWKGDSTNYKISKRNKP